MKLSQVPIMSLPTPKQTPVPLPPIVGMTSGTPSQPRNTPVPLPPIAQLMTPLGERSVNTAQAPQANPQPDGANKKKRKSTVSEADDLKAKLFPEDMEEIDDEDRRITSMPPETCSQIRRKIRNWTESGAQKIGEFQREIGVSSQAYNRFMKLTGTWDGEGTDTYWKAMVFFRKREILGLPLKAPQAKKAKPTPEQSAKTAALLDVSGVSLPGEKTGSVPVFETCNNVRKQIRALLAKDGVTQAAFVRAVNSILPDDVGKSINSMNMRTFMGQTDIMGGNTSIVFYGAYVFFERQRIKNNKPKSAFREEMEKVHGPRGVDVEHNSKGYLWLHDSEVAYMDKYGKLHIQNRRGFR